MFGPSGLIILIQESTIFSKHLLLKIVFTRGTGRGGAFEPDPPLICQKKQSLTPLNNILLHAIEMCLVDRDDYPRRPAISCPCIRLAPKVVW